VQPELLCCKTELKIKKEQEMPCGGVASDIIISMFMTDTSAANICIVRYLEAL
jgi:hypothetical protein